MKRTADRLFGNDYHWSVLGAGRNQMPIARDGAPRWAATCASVWRTGCGSARASSPNRTPRRCRRSARSSRGLASTSRRRPRRARCSDSRAQAKRTSDHGAVVALANGLHIYDFDTQTVQFIADPKATARRHASTTERWIAKDVSSRVRRPATGACSHRRGTWRARSTARPSTPNATSGRHWFLAGAYSASRPAARSSASCRFLCAT